MAVLFSERPRFGNKENFSLDLEGKLVVLDRGYGGGGAFRLLVASQYSERLD